MPHAPSITCGGSLAPCQLVNQAKARVRVRPGDRRIPDLDGSRADRRRPLPERLVTVAAGTAAQKGIAEQIRSTQAQMFEQNALVATWNPVHMQRWEDAVALGDRGATAVSQVHDAVITRVSAAASVADHHHDDTVHNLLFPAFKQGNHKAANAALLKANRYVQVPYNALLKCGHGSTSCATKTSRPPADMPAPPGSWE